MLVAAPPLLATGCAGVPQAMLTGCWPAAARDAAAGNLAQAAVEQPKRIVFHGFDVDACLIERKRALAVFVQSQGFHSQVFAKIGQQSMGVVVHLESRQELRRDQVLVAYGLPGLSNLVSAKVPVGDAVSQTRPAARAGHERATGLRRRRGAAPARRPPALPRPAARSSVARSLRRRCSR